MLTAGAGLLWASAAFAQSSAGSMSGAVSDPNLAVVPAAKVTATNSQTGNAWTTVTSAAGLYLFPSLQPGTYSITVEHPGFKKSTQSGIQILLAQRVTLNLKLELGEVAQTVEISAVAPLLSSTTSELGTNFQPKLMQNAPLFTGGIRNPQAFIAFMPGVNNGSGDSSINGSSRRSKEVLMDGASFTIPESGGTVFNFPAAEMFGEFRLLTNNFAAEYGRTGGGIEIYTPRSGTNDIHGSLYQNIRRDVLDANAWANNRAGRPRPKTRLNEQGLGVGGPIWIPKLYDGRNKSFFFLTYTRRRQPAGVSTAISTVPTAAMKTGDLTETGRAIYDPATTSGNTRQPFAGNRIPSSRFSQITQKILPLYPNPTDPGIVNNFANLNVLPFKDDIWSIKFDHAIRAANRVSFFFTNQNQDSPQADLNLPGPISHGLTTQQRPRNVRVNHDWNLRPTMLLHTTVAFSDTRQFFQNPEQIGWTTRLGLTGLVGRAQTNAFPVVNFDPTDRLTALAATNGPKNVGSQINSTWHLNQALSWVRGKHEFKMGWDVRNLGTYADPLDIANGQGTFTFRRNQTALPTALGTTGHSFASFLLGGVDNATVTLAANSVEERTRYGYRAAFFQDNWRIRPGLTLNLGVRWDFGMPRDNKLDEFTSFSPTLANPAAGNRLGALAYAGEGAGRTGRKRFGDLVYGQFGPRLGLAWQVNPKTVVRGGYGIYYAAANHTTGGFCLGCAFGFSAEARWQSDNINPSFSWDRGFQAPPGFIEPPFINPAFANGGSPWFLSPRSGRMSRHHNWNFNIQRELPKGLLFDIAWVGQRGSDLNSTIQMNQLDPSFLRLGALLTRPINDPAVAAQGFREPFQGFQQLYGNSATLAQALRPFPQFRDIPDHYGAIGQNWYDALQTKVEKRFGDTIFMFGYVWSKTQSLGSRTQTAFNEEPQNSLDFASEKALQLYDWPHVVNFLGSWDVPLGKGKRFVNQGGISNVVLGGWSVASTLQYRLVGNLLLIQAPNTLSGSLFTNFKRANVTGSGVRTNTSRGDLDPSDPSSRWLNPAAFSQPGQFEFGSASRYLSAARNPGVLNENISIIKRTTLFTRGDQPVFFEWRADFFNLFNRSNFGGINATITSPDFGRPTGAQTGARLITMGGRIQW